MSNYTANLTPLRSAVTIAGVSSSVFFLGNVTNAYFGVIPAIQHISSLSKKQRADAWLYFYERAKLVFLPSAIISTASFATVAYLTTRQSLRTYSLIGLVTSGLIGPFTVIQLGPVNDAITAASKGDETKEKYVDALVEKWRKAHVVRLVLGGVSYVAALLVAAEVTI